MPAASDRRIAAVSSEEAGKVPAVATPGRTILAAEARAPIRELAVVGGEREPRLRYLSLVHAEAPEGEEVDVGIDVALVKTHLSLVRVDVRVPDQPRGNDELEGRGGVRGEDRVAEEGGGDEARKCVQVVGTIVDGGIAAVGRADVTVADGDAVVVIV